MVNPSIYFHLPTVIFACRPFPLIYRLLVELAKFYTFTFSSKSHLKKGIHGNGTLTLIHVLNIFRDILIQSFDKRQTLHQKTFKNFFLKALRQNMSFFIKNNLYTYKIKCLLTSTNKRFIWEQASWMSFKIWQIYLPTLPTYLPLSKSIVNPYDIVILSSFPPI